jgi:GAF domain-containing protein
MSDRSSRPSLPFDRSSRPSLPAEKDSAERRFQALVLLTRRLSDSHLLQDLMPVVVREVLEVLGMDRGVLLLDEGAGGYETVVTCGGQTSDAYTPTDQDATRALFEEVKATRRPVMTFSQGPASDSDSSFWTMGSVVGLPLLDRSRFLGVLCVDSASKRVNFEGDHLAFLEAVASVAALAVTNARAHTRMLEAQKLSEDFGNLLDLEGVLDRALSRIVQLTRAEQGFLLLRNEAGNLEQRAGKDRKGRQLPESGDRFLSQRIVKSVADTGEAVLSDNIAEMGDFGEQDGSVVQLGLTSILCVPIRGRTATLGVVYLENRLLKGVFDEEEKRLVQIVADRAGTAIEAAKLFQQQREILRALANAVEARDVGTSSHVQRVSHFALAVGQSLGLDNEQLMQLEQSALLHDIGKIGIPDRVLLKQGPLSDEEWEMMKEHPQLGLGIVGPVALPKDVRDGILYHQEAWNGRGYPFGLSGEDIPLFGRIIAVVDAFDAMTTNRPYRKGRSVKEAAEELNRCAGEQFDPEVVWAFLSVLNDEDEV